MNADMELHIISKNLIYFLVRCPKHYIYNNNVFDIFNNWSETTGVKLSFIQSVEWAYQYINELKNNRSFNFEIAASLLQ